MWVHDHIHKWEGAILRGEKAAPGTLCRELYKNGYRSRYAVWVKDSGGPKGTNYCE